MVSIVQVVTNYKISNRQNAASQSITPTNMVIVVIVLSDILLIRKVGRRVMIMKRGSTSLDSEEIIMDIGFTTLTFSNVVKCGLVRLYF